jgi:hypothetical protein
MIRTLACLAIAASLAGFAAHATPASVQEAFGNTILSTYPDGRKAELWLQPSGVYSAKGRRGDASSGHWSIKAAKLCLKQAHPFPAPFTFCTPLPSNGLNGTWSAKAVTGEAIKVKLVKGAGQASAGPMALAANPAPPRPVP